MTPRAVALTGALVVVFGSAAPSLAVAAETCTGHGLAYPCVDSEVQDEIVPIPWENGLAGTVDPANATPVHTTWPIVWNATGQPLEDGLKVEAFYEAPITLYSAAGLVAHDNHTDLPITTGADGQRHASTTPAIRVLSYTVHFNASQIMSGASEFYWRSPLHWNSALYQRHYVEAHDEAGRLVFAASYDPSILNGPTNSMQYGDRLLYHFVSRLDAGTSYTFTEYVNLTHWQNGLDHFTVYVGDHQDIDQDGTLGLIAFPGEPGQRSFDGSFDPGFSFRFIHGEGPGGSMNLLAPTRGSDTVTLKTGAFLGRNASSTQNRYTLNLPLRTTFPLDVTVALAGCKDYATYRAQLATQNCGGQPLNGFGLSRTLHGVTGSLHETFTCNCTQALGSEGPHYFYVTLTVTNFAPHPDANGTETHLVTYPMYTDLLPDGNVGTHVLTRSNTTLGRLTEVQPVDWTAWAEVTEDQEVQHYSFKSQTTHSLLFLSPRALVIAGVLLIAAGLVFGTINMPLILAGGALIGLANMELDGRLIPQAGENMLDVLKGAFIAASCTAAFLAPTLGAAIGTATVKNPIKGALVGKTIGSAIQPVAAVGCAYGVACSADIVSCDPGLLIPQLIKAFMEIPRIIKASVEVVAQTLSSLLLVVVALWNTFGAWVYLFLYTAMGFTAVWLLRESFLVVIGWLLAIFLAIPAKHAVRVLQRGEVVAKLLPCPLWDMAMRKRGALRGDYYRSTALRNRAVIR